MTLHREGHRGSLGKQTGSHSAPGAIQHSILPEALGFLYLGCRNTLPTHVHVKCWVYSVLSAPKVAPLEPSLAHPVLPESPWFLRTRPMALFLLAPFQFLGSGSPKPWECSLLKEQCWSLTTREGRGTGSEMPAQGSRAPGDSWAGSRAGWLLLQ